MKNTECQPMAKRLLSVLFAITLVVGLVPISAYAANDEAGQETTQSQEQQEPQGTEGVDAGSGNSDTANEASETQDESSDTQSTASEEDSVTQAENGQNGVAQFASILGGANAVSNEPSTVADKSLTVEVDGTANITNGGSGYSHSWETSNSSIATAKDNSGSASWGSRKTGKAIVTGVKPGTVTITHKYKSGALIPSDKSETFTVEVVKAPIAKHVKLTGTSVNAVYDGEAHAAGTATVSGNNGHPVVVEYQKADGSWTKNPADITATNVADSTTVNVRASVPDYYEGYVNATEELKVTQRPVTFTGNSGTKTYNGSEQTVSGFTTNDGKGTGLVSGQSSNVKASASGTLPDTYAGTITDADDVVIKSGEADVTTNYSIETKPGTLVITGVEGTITVTAASGSKVYDGTALTNDGFTYTDGVLLEGDVLSAVVEGSATNVGDEGVNTVTSYKVMRGDTDVTSAYIFADSVDGKLTVTAQSINPEEGDKYLDVKIDDPKNTVYNGEEQKWSPEVNHEGGSELVMGNDYTVTYMRGNQVTDDLTSAGVITVVIKGQGNYTGTVTKTYEILKQSVDPEEEDAYLGVQIDNPENVVYNGKDQKWVPAVTDIDGEELDEGTDYTVEYSTDDFTNAGEIKVTIAGIGNYTGEVECAYVIEKAAIRVADSATKVYNGAEQMFYVQATGATGLAEGEVLTLSDAQVKGTEPGVYTDVSSYTWKVVKADKTDSTGNYTINVSGALTITAADSAAADTSNGNSAKADNAGKGTAPQTGDATAPLAAGAAIAAAAALVALFVSRKLRRNGTR